MCFRDILTCSYFNAKMINLGLHFGGRLVAEMLSRYDLGSTYELYVTILAPFSGILFLAVFLTPFWLQSSPQISGRRREGRGSGAMGKCHLET